MSEKGKGCVTLAGIFMGLFALTYGVLALFVLHRVDAGNVGILVNYNLTNGAGKPKTEIVLPGNYEWIFPWSGQALFEYPVAQQSLVMAYNSQEGEVQGHDAVPCQDKNGNQIGLDVTVQWQVNPSQAGTLYFLRPNQSLTGSFNNDVESTIVRPVVRNAIQLECSSYSWDNIGANKAVIAASALPVIQQALVNDGILVNSGNVFIGDVTYSASQDQAIAAKATAQQQAEQAQYDQQKAQYEAAAAIAKASGEARAIAILNQALSSNPNYLQYLAISKWNGMLPQVTGGGTPFIHIK